MRWYRLVPVLLVLVGVLLLTGALTRPKTGPLAPAAPAAPPLPSATAPDPATLELLDRAYNALRPSQVVWLETDVWQRIQLGELRCEAEGRYLMGAGPRFRLELRTQSGGHEGTALMVYDGATLWQAGRSSTDGPWETVSRLSMIEVFTAPVEGPAGWPQQRAEFLQSTVFYGVFPLLHNLRKQLNWVQNRAVRRDETDWIELTGVWAPEVAALLAPADQPWPAGLPRQCRLTLDARNLWPTRLEWWGPTADQGPDALLVEMEFRNPIFGRVLTLEAYTETFTFDPGKATVFDQTPAVTAALTIHAQEQASASANRTMPFPFFRGRPAR